MRINEATADFLITYQTNCQKIRFRSPGRVLLFAERASILPSRIERALSWCDRSADGLPNFISVSAENRLPVYFRFHLRFPTFHLDLVASDYLWGLQKFLVNFTESLYEPLAECVG